MRYLLQFLGYRRQVKTELILDVIPNCWNTKMHIFLLRNRLKNGYNGYKNIDMLYLSNGAR